jgi:4-hydroxy-2-oxoheptanedioate aldolase
MHVLKNRFEAGEPAYGLWTYLPGAQLARAVARAGNLDCIIVDCEHGLIALQGGAQDTVSAIRQTSAHTVPSVLVRIPAVDDASRTWQIKVALDSGAQGVPLFSH